MIDEIDDCAFLGGQLQLRQFRRGHRAGTDACLLAAAIDVQAGACVVDVGAGVGGAGLALLRRAPEATVVLVERDASVRALCEHNVAANGVNDRARVVETDVLDRSALSRAELLGSADLVISNPPFFEPMGHHASPDPRRRDAHVLAGGSLSDWLLAMMRIAKPRGQIVMVHRADALADIINGLPPSYGAVRLRSVHSRADRPASRILLAATAGSRTPLTVLPPLVLHGEGHAFTQEADAIHRGVGNPLL